MWWPAGWECHARGWWECRGCTVGPVYRPKLRKSANPTKIGRRHTQRAEERERREVKSQPGVGWVASCACSSRALHLVDHQASFQWLPPPPGPGARASGPAGCTAAAALLSISLLLPSPFLLHEQCSPAVQHSSNFTLQTSLFTPHSSRFTLQTSLTSTSSTSSTSSCCTLPAAPRRLRLLVSSAPRWWPSAAQRPGGPAPRRPGATSAHLAGHCETQRETHGGFPRHAPPAGRQTGQDRTQRNATQRTAPQHGIGDMRLFARERQAGARRRKAVLRTGVTVALWAAAVVLALSHGRIFGGDGGEAGAARRELGGGGPTAECPEETIMALPYLLIVLYCFIGLAIVCDDYFEPSLSTISEKLCVACICTCCTCTCVPLRHFRSCITHTQAKPQRPVRGRCRCHVHGHRLVRARAPHQRH